VVASERDAELKEGSGRSSDPDFVGRDSPDFFENEPASFFGKPWIVSGDAAVTGVHL
jgi:hypothetical protein